jgi:mannitol-1-phosphate/altronate dehydrogenase
VDPYEETKIRVLNGGHTALAYLGALAGFLNFDEVMKNPETADHFERFESEEVTRALPPSLPFDVDEYVATVSRRFSNQYIADSVERIVSDGFAKFPQFIRPTVRGCLEQGHVPEHAFRSIASWYHFTRKSLAGTMSIPYREPNMQVLSPLVANEELFADSELLWGDLREKYPLFKPELCKAIRAFEA